MFSAIATRARQSFKCIIHNATTRRAFYDSSTNNDTIFAPSTALHPIRGSPLAVIRISGTETAQILEKLTDKQPTKTKQSRDRPNNGPPRGIIEPRLAKLSHFRNPRTRELFDTGLALWFPAPASYTGEDVAELHLHGSQAVVGRVLRWLGDQPGLRPAEPGEFTRRAVQNDKMSLMEAEGVADLIAAQTDEQRKLALRGLDGSTRRLYDGWRGQLVELLARLEASIDFGEDELVGEAEALQRDCSARLAKLHEEIARFVDESSRHRQLVQAGCKLVILGRPNAGKSTLMNMLCRTNKSIVSEVSGTTRDLVEHSFELAGHAVTLLDTAGLRNLEFSQETTNNNKSKLEQHDAIEREGISRALAAAKHADVIIYLIEAGAAAAAMTPTPTVNEKLIANELEAALGVARSGQTKVIHLVISKIDLNQALLEQAENLRQNAISRHHLAALEGAPRVCVSFLSCLARINYDNFVKSLADSLKDCLASDQANDDNINGLNCISNQQFVTERHLALLRAALKNLEQATTDSSQQVASHGQLEQMDILAQHVRESLDYLSRIVGSVTNDEVLDVIFRDFCIGK